MMAAIFIAYLLNFVQRLFMVLQINGCITYMQIRYSSRITSDNEIRTSLFVLTPLLFHSNYQNSERIGRLENQLCHGFRFLDMTSWPFDRAQFLRVLGTVNMVS